MSGYNQQGIEKDNPITRRARMVQELRNTYGSRATGGGVPPEVLGSLGAAPIPDASMMQSGLDEEGRGGLTTGPPLDPDEAKRREQAWAAQTGQRIGEGEPGEDEGAGYASAEDVAAAATLDDKLRAAKPGQVVPLTKEQLALMRSGQFKYPTETANFSRLQRVDFEERTVTVSGMAFPFTEDEAAELAHIVVRIVGNAVRQDLLKALQGLPSPPGFVVSSEPIRLAVDMPRNPPLITGEGVSSADDSDTGGAG